MRALNSHFVLIDLQSSWQSAQQLPGSTFAYLRNCKATAPSFSSAIRRARGRTGKIASSRAPLPAHGVMSPEIRKPQERSPAGNGLYPLSSNTASTSSSVSGSDGVISDLDLFLQIVPLRMKHDLIKHEEIGELIEVVMDLGRKPLARFPSGDWVISEDPVKLEDLSDAISKVGDFSDDNRAGINYSLHRISAIRNRKLHIIGLTCRVGRAVSGSAEVIRDLVEGGGSILLIGPPGVGKTTLIREIARILADHLQKRVVIVDTSNEIGGDGDVPHSGIGRARRMQVPNVHMQHNVMIEAVENHMPETIIIDEIGTELEALAAGTISQRGVQLVATAHGITIESIIKNPTLQSLVGGVESVTLGDEEARKRKVQKTILERKGPPPFTCAIEIVSKTEYRVHHRLDATVDAILAGKSPLFEVRCIDSPANNSSKSSLTPEADDILDIELSPQKSKLYKDRRMMDEINTTPKSTQPAEGNYLWNTDVMIDSKKKSKPEKLGSDVAAQKHGYPKLVYTRKIDEADFLQVATAMGLEDRIDVTDDIDFADAILLSNHEMKQNPCIRGLAKLHLLPIFVVKSTTMAQIVKAIRMILGIDSFSSMQKHSSGISSDIEIEDDAPKRKPSLEEIDALEEVRLAIEYIVIPGGEPVELLPRRSDIVARQLELVESYQLAVENSGTESNPRLQILPQRLSRRSPNPVRSFVKQGDRKMVPGGSGGGAGVVVRLPFLPEQ